MRWRTRRKESPVLKEQLELVSCVYFPYIIETPQSISLVHVEFVVIIKYRIDIYVVLVRAVP